MLASWIKLHGRGILGMNARNALYIEEYNERRLHPLVNDKLRTKELAEAHGVAVPPLYGVINYNYEARHFEKLTDGREDFVVKPAKGAGGDGILVIAGKSWRNYRRGSGLPVSAADIAHHISNILSGMYSLSGQVDRAILEYRVEPDPLFQAVSFQGVPDLRLLVFLGVPTMAMVRLPTRKSDGKANLHKGGLGAGIDIATGVTGRAIQGDRVLKYHPDTDEPVAGIEIPQWEDLMLLAARCYELTGLGYLGVDIVLDRSKGPLILELNARPGLSLQIANAEGLRARLDAIEAEHKGLTTPEDRVAFATDLARHTNAALAG